jgi:hypothetical protein
LGVLVEESAPVLGNGAVLGAPVFRAFASAAQLVVKQFVMGWLNIDALSSKASAGTLPVRVHCVQSGEILLLGLLLIMLNPGATRSLQGWVGGVNWRQSVV